jgi:hypothetical protein
LTRQPAVSVIFGGVREPCPAGEELAAEGHYAAITSTLSTAGYGAVELVPQAQ